LFRYDHFGLCAPTRIFQRPTGFVSAGAVKGAQIFAWPDAMFEHLAKA